LVKSRRFHSNPYRSTPEKIIEEWPPAGGEAIIPARPVVPVADAGMPVIWRPCS
jgi:hypothetical protein